MDAARQCACPHPGTGLRCENTAEPGEWECLACALGKEKGQELVDRLLAPVELPAGRVVAALNSAAEFAPAVDAHYTAWYPRTREWAKRRDEERGALGADGRLVATAQENHSVSRRSLGKLAATLGERCEPLSGRDSKPSVDELAAAAGLSPSTVERGLRLLVFWGFRVVARTGRLLTPGERSVFHRYARGRARTYRGLATDAVLTIPRSAPAAIADDKTFEGPPLVVPAALRAASAAARRRANKHISRPGDNPRPSRLKRSGAPRRAASKKGGLPVDGEQDAARRFQSSPLCPRWAAGMSPLAVAIQMRQYLREGRSEGFFIGALEYYPYQIPPWVPEKKRYGLLGSIFKLYARFRREDERIAALPPDPARAPRTGLSRPLRSPAVWPLPPPAKAPPPAAADLPQPAAPPEPPRTPSPTSDDDYVPAPDPYHLSIRTRTRKETPEQRRARIEAQLSHRPRS